MAKAKTKSASAATDTKTLAKQIATSHPELWEKLKDATTQLGRPASEVVAEIAEVMEEPVYAKLKDTEKKIFHAARTVYTRLCTNLLRKTETYEVRVIDFMPTRHYEKNGKKGAITNLYGLGAKVDEEGALEEVGYVRITSFDDKADKWVNKVKRGTTYRGQFSGKFKNGIYSLSCDTDPRFEVVEESEIPEDAKEVLETIFEFTTLDELSEDNKSKGRDDLKLVYAQVTVATVKPQKKDKTKNYGMLILMDESLDPSTLGSGGPTGLTVFCDPTQVRFGSGSDVYAIGSIDVNARGATMNVECIIPGDIIYEAEVNSRKSSKVEAEDVEDIAAWDDEEEEEEEEEDEEEDDESPVKKSKAPPKPTPKGKAKKPEPEEEEEEEEEEEDEDDVPEPPEDDDEEEEEPAPKKRKTPPKPAGKSKGKAKPKDDDEDDEEEADSDDVVDFDDL